MSDKPSDPADKATDAKADGAFGGVSHRAGYGDDKLARLIDFLRRHPRATLASGEGALLLAEMDRMRAGAKDLADHYDDACVEINRLRDQLYLADESARSSSAEAARLRAEIDRLNAQWERLTSDAVAEKVARAIHNAHEDRFTYEVAFRWEDTAPHWQISCRRSAQYALAAARDAARGEGT